MKAFCDIVTFTIKNLGMKKRFYEEIVLINWRKIVGDKLASHTFPVKIQRGVLMVGTSSSVWSHHLVTMKENIVYKINEFAGEKVVSDIKFQAGYLKKDQNEENTSEADVPSINWRQVVLSNDDIRSIDSIASGISDEKLFYKVKEILRRDRALQVIRRKKNWHDCSACGILCPPEEDLCPVCTVEKRATEKEKLLDLLVQAPWMSYQDCRKYIQCWPTDFNTAKREMTDRLIRTLDQKNDDGLTLATLVMLINAVKPEEVSEELIAKTMDKIRGKKNVSAPRS
ncbi:MAG: DUF721 domain-containing protein [Negativicutes bacterium]|nr:DUF721 domain-containing protein [Negativicutes bacterium]